MSGIILFFVAINLLAFVLYGIDKWKARHQDWRISEATLLWVAALGGALGALIGMKVWRHKTQHKMFKYGIPALLLVQIVIVILLSGAAYLLSYSLNPVGREQRDNTSMEYLSQYPGVAEWVDSMQTVGSLRDTFIRNNEDLRLHALCAAHKDAKGTAILVHGYTDNALRMMMLGKLYYDSLQYNILAMDHVRHGQSEGNAIQMGWLDRLNVERWIDIADSLWNGVPIYLHGISMGGATVMMCSGDALPSSVKGIIDDCGYTSVWDEFSGEIENQFGLPIHPLMDLASWMCQLKYGWNFKEASALEQVSRSTLPILFIHGGNDTFVPTDMAYTLFGAKKKGRKQFWIAPGSAHAQSYKDHPKEYFREMKTFINTTTQQ